jgi:D-alanyl-D-alanine carboxypeptidase
MMNARASELNMKNTVFRNPTGAYDTENLTTAADLLLLLRTALSRKNFRDLMTTQFVVLTRAYGVQQTIVNQNQLIFTRSGDVTGGKSQYPAYTNPQSVVTLAVKDDFPVVALVLHATYDTLYTDTEAILQYGFDNFRRDVLVGKGVKVTSIEVEQQTVGLVAGETTYYVYPAREVYLTNIRFVSSPDLSLPLSAESIAGTASYEMADNTVIQVKLYPDRDYYRPRTLLSDLMTRLDENREIYLFIAFLLILEGLILLSFLFRAAGKAVRKIRKRVS